MFSGAAWQPLPMAAAGILSQPRAAEVSDPGYNASSPAKSRERNLNSKKELPLRVGTLDRAVVLEVLDLCHRQGCRSGASRGAVDPHAGRILALGAVKKARAAAVAAEDPIHRNRVNASRNISLGKVEAVSRQRTQN